MNLPEKTFMFGILVFSFTLLCLFKTSMYSFLSVFDCTVVSNDASEQLMEFGNSKEPSEFAREIHFLLMSTTSLNCCNPFSVFMQVVSVSDTGSTS